MCTDDKDIKFDIEGKMPVSIEDGSIKLTNTMVNADDPSAAYEFSDIDISILTRMANDGDPLAQFKLAECYTTGNGVSVDYQDAVKWYEKASEQGNIAAKYQLSKCYENGIGGLENDFTTSFFLLQDAVAGENAFAQNHLAKWTLETAAREEDKESAFQLFEKAASSGCNDAKYNLATCYRDGIGVKEDTKKALKLFTELATGGNADSQLIVGQLYENARGIPTDLAEAERWYTMAADGGNEDAIAALKRLNNPDANITVLSPEVSDSGISVELPLYTVNEEKSQPTASPTYDYTYTSSSYAQTPKVTQAPKTTQTSKITKAPKAAPIYKATHSPKAPKKSKSYRSSGLGIGGFFSKVFSSIGNFFSRIFSAIGGFFSNTFPTIGSFFSRIFSWIGSLFGKASDAFGGYEFTIASVINVVVLLVLGGAIALISTDLDWVGAPFNALADWFSTLMEGIPFLAEEVFGLLERTTDGIFDNFFVVLLAVLLFIPIVVLVLVTALLTLLADGVIRLLLLILFGIAMLIYIVVCYVLLFGLPLACLAYFIFRLVTSDNGKIRYVIYTVISVGLSVLYYILLFSQV